MGLLRRGRVLPGQLRGGAFLAFLLAIETGFPPPGALEIVAHVEAEPAEAFRLELDLVAVLEAAEPAVVGAGSARSGP